MYNEFVNKYIIKRFDLTDSEVQIFLGYFKDYELELFKRDSCDNYISFCKSWAIKIKAIFNSEYEKSSLLALKLYKHGAISRNFDFLGPTFKKWINLSMLNKLAMPAFDTKGLDFGEVYSFNFKEIMSFKCFCKILNDYGVNGLNNLYYFKEVKYDLNTDMCLNLPFEKQIKDDVATEIKYLSKKSLDLLNRMYSYKRLYKVLTSFDEKEDIKAFFEMLEYHSSNKNIINRLPRQPRDYKDIVRSIGFRNFSNFKESFYNIDYFEQDVRPYHGKIIKDYTLFIPSSFADLCEGSFYMRNCIKSYVEKIIDKKSVIVLLKRGDKFRICFELIKVEQTWEVKEAKGAQNRELSEHENEVVKEISNELIRYLVEELQSQ